MQKSSAQQFYYLVYKITNLINNKFYIGIHRTTNKNDDYMGSGVNIKRAIKKYGLENFKKEILFECKNAEEMAAKEAEIVTPEFLKRDDVYNLAKGGYLGWIKAHEELTEENFKAWGKTGAKIFKDKLADPKFFNSWYIKMIEKINSPEAKFKRSQHLPSFTGKSHSEETKKKMSEKAKTHTGEKNSCYGMIWIYNEKLQESKKIKKDDLNKYLNDGWMKGRKMFNLTDNAREKMSSPTKGCFWITNGVNTKQCFNENDIPDGWYKGRTIKRK